jgi:galactose-1-phosphate uridylyltransferase (family 1)
VACACRQSAPSERATPRTVTCALATRGRLARLPAAELLGLLRALQAEQRAVSALPGVEHVLVFENKGQLVGVSNPHPHCQLYATNFVPKTIELELLACQRHWDETGRVLFRDIIDAERADGRRVLVDSQRAIAFVPYFARYAYETFVAPKRTYRSIAEVPDDELVQLGEALKQVLVRYDNLWETEFPYVMALHQAPSSTWRARKSALVPLLPIPRRKRRPRSYAPFLRCTTRSADRALRAMLEGRHAGSRYRRCRLHRFARGARAR